MVVMLTYAVQFDIWDNTKHGVNMVAADDLAPSGVRPSATTLLNYFTWYQFDLQQWCSNIIL